MADDTESRARAQRTRNAINGIVTAEQGPHRRPYESHLEKVRAAVAPKPPTPPPGRPPLRVELFPEPYQTDLEPHLSRPGRHGVSTDSVVSPAPTPAESERETAFDAGGLVRSAELLGGSDSTPPIVQLVAALVLARRLADELPPGPSSTRLAVSIERAQGVARRYV